MSAVSEMTCLELIDAVVSDHPDVIANDAQRLVIARLAARQPSQAMAISCIQHKLHLLCGMREPMPESVCDQELMALA